MRTSAKGHFVMVHGLVKINRPETTKINPFGFHHMTLTALSTPDSVPFFHRDLHVFKGNISKKESRINIFDSCVEI